MFRRAFVSLQSKCWIHSLTKEFKMERISWNALGNDILKSAIINDGPVNSNVTGMLEILRGIDEMSVKLAVDKLNIMCYVSLKNIKEIKDMSRDELIQIIQLAKMPPSMYMRTTSEGSLGYKSESSRKPGLELANIDILQTIVRNIMLTVIEKMSRNELICYLNKIGWKTMSTIKDDLIPVLKLWVFAPDCTIFNAPKKNYNFCLEPLTKSFISNLKLFHVDDVNSFSKETLMNILAARHQSSSGSIENLRNQLMAFQEMIILHFYDKNDCRKLLESIFWTRKLNVGAIDYLRQLCIAYLRYPACNKFYSRKPDDVATSSRSWSPEEDEILRKSYQQALIITKNICNRNEQDLKRPPIIGECEPLLSNRSGLHFKAKSIDFDFIQQVPSQLKMNLLQLYENAPVFAHGGELLWTKGTDFELKTNRLELWMVVFAISSRLYGLRKTSKQLQDRWTFLKLLDSSALSKDISSKGSTNMELSLRIAKNRFIYFNNTISDSIKFELFKQYQLNLDDNFEFHSDFVKFDKILFYDEIMRQDDPEVLCSWLRKRRQPTVGELSDLKNRLVNYQDCVALYLLTKEDKKDILLNAGWIKSDLIKKKDLDILRYMRFPSDSSKLKSFVTASAELDSTTLDSAVQKAKKIYCRLYSDDEVAKILLDYQSSFDSHFITAEKARALNGIHLFRGNKKRIENSFWKLVSCIVYNTSNISISPFKCYQTYDKKSGKSKRDKTDKQELNYLSVFQHKEIPKHLLLEKNQEKLLEFYREITNSVYLLRSNIKEHLETNYFKTDDDEELNNIRFKAWVCNPFHQLFLMKPEKPVSTWMADYDESLLRILKKSAAHFMKHGVSIHRILDKKTLSNLKELGISTHNCRKNSIAYFLSEEMGNEKLRLNSDTFFELAQAISVKDFDMQITSAMIKNRIQDLTEQSRKKRKRCRYSIRRFKTLTLLSSDRSRNIKVEDQSFDFEKLSQLKSKE